MSFHYRRPIVGKVKEDKDITIYQFTLETVNGVGLDYEREAVITLDKSTGDITSTDDTLTEKIKARVMQENEKYHSIDIRSMFYKVMQKHGHTIRPRSGVWFVLSSEFEWIDRLINFARCVGCNAEEHPVIDLTHEKEQLSRTYEDDAREALEELSQEIDAMIDAKKSPRIIEKRLEEINFLQSKCDLYQKALGIQQEGVQKRIEELNNRLRKNLGLTGPATD